MADKLSPSQLHLQEHEAFCQSVTLPDLSGIKSTVDAGMAETGTLRRLWIDTQEWGIRQFDRASRSPLAPHLRTGLAGERAALFELSRRGYIVVARRWTSSRLRGDLDLIAWQGDRLCFVEVKTRTAHDIAPAESAVDDDKRRTVRRLARAYLRSFPSRERDRIPTRFDVVSVYLLGSTPEFAFFPDAFGWD
jgi:putative endonuclease